ncbi:class I SAM-dependent methyltransferase [Stakelama marina]|uniref:Class I SAM-dependent methyltransferase n=1 Tax=Stakelama marina TaxID=2826939 RepID=A0A8T4IM64_9SPHN|nr:methyltransferase domain-containing protein [Stakelama marina]MBR0553399.1 class I SAM-dependent methyltransferase [Stakelama marina]
MGHRLALIAIGTTLAAVTSVAVGAPQIQREALREAARASTRTPANVARDRYRHPVDTLAFFNVAPDDTVVEIWPGGGWYTEILAPYLKDKGTLYEAAPNMGGLKAVRAMQQRDRATYGNIRLASFPAGDTLPKVPEGTADVVLTFRNAHNWQQAGPEVAQNAFDQMYAMLKPGGTLGIVDHRLPEAMPSAREGGSGYMKVSTITGYARKAGFKLADMSEVNANPADTHDYASGVWTLPPTYTLGDTDRDKYAAIGESDRMTIRFRKPK